MGHSVLVVPVPELEAFVRARWQHYEPDWVSTDPGFTHAHITVLAPWITDPSAKDLATVAGIAASSPAFGFRLDRVAQFPDGVIHAPPAPDHGFRALTTALAQAFPDHPPYGGAFGGVADVVPHLTLDHAAAGITPGDVAAWLEGTLPATCWAERVEWHWYDEGDCRRRAAWPLGR